MTKELEERLALLERQLAEAKQTTSKPQKRRWPLSPKKTAVILLVITLLALGGWLSYTQFSSQDQVPASVREQLSFPIYIPSDPAYKIDESSFSVSPDIISFTVRHGDSTFIVTEQELSGDFDISKFTYGVTDPKVSTIPLGTLLTGTVLSKQTAILATSDKLLISVSVMDNTSKSPKPLLEDLEKVAL